MREKVYVRVTKSDEGIKRELMLEGVKIADLTFHETVQLVMQAASSLRWEKQ